MREPGIDAPGPLLQIQFGKRRAINLLQSKQNIAHFPLRMAGNPTIGRRQSRRRRNCIHMVVFLVENIFEGNGCPAPCGNSPQS